MPSAATSSPLRPSTAGLATDAEAWWLSFSGHLLATFTSIRGRAAMNRLMTLRAKKTITIPVIAILTPWPSAMFCKSKLKFNEFHPVCEQ